MGSYQLALLRSHLTNFELPFSLFLLPTIALLLFRHSPASRGAHISSLLFKTRPSFPGRTRVGCAVRLVIVVGP
ncbi:hypothetical protein F4809DRAFT_548112 [Biscogniauxia mediterranea]|nr:hypothetical protein F4809DRAFT_548112 [Biscogniauxia mediterranea]